MISKTKVMGMVCLAALLVSSLSAQAASGRLIFDGRGGGLLSLGRDFHASKTYTGDDGKVHTEKDESDGSFSFHPGALFGYGVETKLINYDVKTGFGGLIGSSVIAPAALSEFNMAFKIGRLLTVGPHIGLNYYFAPDYQGDADMDLDNAFGVLTGGRISFGREDVSFFATADFMFLEFDVDKTKNGWTTSDKDLDMSGVAVQIGVALRM